jgi:hypothetical protein
MIRHVVMFKFKPEADGDEVKKVLDALRLLPDKIEVIREYEVGEDVLRTPRSWDAVLVSTFDDLNDLQTYAVHDDHLAVVQLIQTLVQTVASVDFEF